MDELFLIAPSMAYERQIRAYRAEILADGEGVDGGGGLDAFEDVADWLAYLALKSRPDTCPADRVPDSTYLCVRRADNRVVGMANIRHTLNDLLLQWGGHIGYSIRPDERGKGYAKQQLRLTLDKCRALGLTRVLVTCDETNKRSRHTIEACGGQYEDSRPDSDGAPTRRYWIDIPESQ